MGKYFIGKEVQLLTEEDEEKIKIHKLDLLKEEFGHMPCKKGGFLFLFVEEGELICQVNQECVEIKAGEALFINENQPYRMRESLAKKCSLYMLEISREYLISQDEKLAQKYIEPVANAEAFSYCCFVPSEEDDTDEDILLQAVLAAAQTAQGRDLAYELDMKSWIFTAWGSLYKKFVQIEPACKNAILRERAKLNRMTEYLQENCGQKLTLAQMAGGCQVSTGDSAAFSRNIWV